MQGQFAFVSNDIARWRSRLTPLLADIQALPRRTPAGQLVKSLISGRTRDAVSLGAYHRLGKRFGSAAAIAVAKPTAVECEIADVTFPAMKAEWLVAALRSIGHERPDWRLGFLGNLPIGEALGWLERLPGVGRKVAASTLNASTLARPVLIVDSHVLRVLGRLGVVPTNAEARLASETVTAAMPDWSADDFLRFHIAVKRLGQTVCRFEAPACADCPLIGDCPTGKSALLTPREQL